MGSYRGTEGELEYGDVDYNRYVYEKIIPEA